MTTETPKVAQTLLAGCVLVFAFAAGAATYNVPADYASLADALAVATNAGDVVVLAAQTHTLTNQVTVRKGVTLRGATASWKDTIVSGNGTIAGLLMGEGAVVRDLTVSRCKAAGVTTAKDAVLDNCRVTGCWSADKITWDSKAIAVTAVGGTVTNCVIDGNYGSHAQYNCGVGLLMKSSGKQTPLVTHTVITNNWENYMESDNSNYSGCPGVKALSGTLDHCYIADNYFGADYVHTIPIGSGIYATGAITVRHCSIFSQTYDGAMAPTLYGVYLGNANSTVSDTIIFGNGHTEGVRNDFGVVGTMAASKCSNVVTGSHRDAFDAYVAYAATTDDFIRVGGKWIPRTGRSFSDCGSEPAWDEKTPADPPAVGTTYYVSDVANLQSTIDGAKEGDTVVIRTGTYLLTATLSITTPNLTVRGETDDYADVILDGQNARRCVTMNGRGATLLNVSLVHGYASQDGSGGGAYLACGACLRHCRVGDITAAARWASGIGVYASGAKVVDCVIEDINYAPTQAKVLGAYLTNGSLMDRCVIRNCNFTSSDLNSSYRGRCILGAQLECSCVQNSVICNNSQGLVTSTTHQNTGACYLSSANSSIYNTFVYDNTYNGDSDAIPSYGIYNEGNAPVVNCVSLDNGPKAGARSHNFIGKATCVKCLADAVSTNGTTGCWAGTLAEHFVENGDHWKLRGTSPLVDAGNHLFGVVDGLDFDGTNRVEGAEIDVGPFEYHAPPLAVSLAATSYAALDRLDAVLTATADGDTTGIGYAWYLDDAAEPFAAGGAEKASVPLTLTALGTHTVTVVATNAAAKTANALKTFTVLQGTFYVTNANEHAEAPYDTPEKAATNIADAVALATDGATVRLAPGAYTVTSPVAVTTAVAVVGAGRTREETVVSAGGKTQAFVLSASGASLANLTVSDGYQSSFKAVGASVRLSYGTVMTNCVVRNFSDGNVSHGGAIYNENGTIVDTVISNCTGASYGLALYQTGGYALADRVLVRNNRHTSGYGFDGYRRIANVYLAGGEMRNSMILDCSLNTIGSCPQNRSLVGSGVTVAGSAKLVNCTVSGNSFSLSGDATNAYAYAGAVAIEKDEDYVIRAQAINCLIVDNAGYDVAYADVARAYGTNRLTTCCTYPFDSLPAGNVSSIDGGRVWRRFDDGTVRLTHSSPAIDAGTHQDWMDEGVDYLRRPRILNQEVDIGAVEVLRTGMLLLVK